MSCAESGRVTDYWLHNETYLGPNLSNTVACPPPEWIPLLVIASVFWVATLCICYVAARRFDPYRWTKSLIYVLSRRVLFYYVLTSTLNLLIIFNAKGAGIYAYVSDCLEAVIMMNFYQLIWAYSGGIEVTLKKLIGLEINLGQMPFCCLRCVPNVKITESFMRKLETMLLQLPFVQLIVGLINLSLVQNGVSAILFEHWSTTITLVILAISAVVSIYAIGMLHACWSQFIVGRSVPAKFLVFKATIVLAKIQEAILRICVRYVESYGYHAAKDRAAMWAAFLVCLECLVLCVFASYLYKPSDFDTALNVAAEVRYKCDGVKNLEDDSLHEVDLGKPTLVIGNPNV